MTSIDPVVAQFGMCHRTIHRNLEGVSHDESLRRPDAGGNSANWVLGHLVASRNGLLKRFTGQALLDDAVTAPYARGSKGEIGQGVPIEELLATLDRSQPLLVDRLRKFSEEELAAKAPFGSPAGPDASLGDALAAMAFHEAYHVGQLGVLRRLAGKTGAI
jgi:uncharacterized damage-inducible protein DinB